MIIEKWKVYLGIFLLLGGCSPQVHQGKVVKPDFVNSLGMEFVVVPGGSFLMGSEDGATSEPVHKVTLSSFLIMTKEVTNAQFEEFKKVKRSVYSPDDKMPVMNATRAEVIAFINWLSKKDGRTYMLPTDAQWEYAARGGLEGKDYPWGDEWVDGMANIGGGEKPGGAKAKPVGSYPPNGFGLYDMCGNAAEMVRERGYFYMSHPQTDPIGPVQEPSTSEFVVRGLGVDSFFPWVWYSSSNFDNLPPYTEGFRLVVVQSEPDPALVGEAKEFVRNWAKQKSKVSTKEFLGLHSYLSALVIDEDEDLAIDTLNLFKSLQDRSLIDVAQSVKLNYGDGMRAEKFVAYLKSLRKGDSDEILQILCEGSINHMAAESVKVVRLRDEILGRELMGKMVERGEPAPEFHDPNVVRVINGYLKLGEKQFRAKYGI